MTFGIVPIIVGMNVPACASTNIFYVPSANYPTIQSAYDACSPGDTVVVSNDVYTTANQCNVLDMYDNGSPGAPITVEAANVGGAILDGQNILGSNSNGFTVYIDGNYNVLQGFKVRNGYFGGIAIAECSYNRILKNEVYSNGWVSDNVNGNFGIYDDPTTANNSYIGNYVHDNGRISQGSRYDHGMYLCGTTNEVVMNNLIVGNCDSGIQVASEDVTGVTNMNIYNNTIVSNRYGNGVELVGEMDGINIANNIFYGNGYYCTNVAYGIGTWYCSSTNYHGSASVQIDNNLFYNNLDGAWNMTYGTPDGTVTWSAAGNITNDPEFFNPASNWHVQKCSPAIDSGLTLSAVTNDCDGVPRPIPFGGDYDIGAYER